MAVIDQVFESLFFGSGSWLGLLLFLTIMLALLWKSEYVGVLLLPIAVFMGLEYVSYDLAWHSLIMFFSSIFMLVYMMKKIKR